MIEFNPGGVIPRLRDLPATLAPDECLLDRDGRCERFDDAHHRDQCEARTWSGSVVRTGWGHCLHRHPVPVESTITGEVVAHLCPACDEQLP